MTDSLSDTQVVSNVSSQILKVMQEQEELAYEAGVKDTLNKLLPRLKQIQNILTSNIANIEATLAMDRLINLETEQTKEEGTSSEE